MQLLFAAALDLQRFCEAQGWAHCFIGGLAVQRWGNPRVTKDADLTLLTGFGDEEKFVDPLLARFPGRREDARAFALRYRVLLAGHESGVPFDISLGALPFEANAVMRSSLWEISPGAFLRTCSAEDLIVFKAFASRDQDWADVESVLRRQGPKLGADAIMEELGPLAELKEAPEMVPRLQAAMRRFGCR